MRVYLPRQFAVHLVETLDCVHYVIGYFKMVTESPINREYRGCKLQTNGMLSQRRVLEQKEILTLRAATEAILHEPPVNFDFAHSLRSGVGNGEWRAVSTLLLGVERHRCKKSGKMSNDGRGTG
jgi:hypothetical protein